jgi:hypothetical protein
MGGSKALGICIKRHREPRSQQLLADALGRSPRWMAYVEAGRTDVGWSEMAAIATILGRIKGNAFLEDAIALLYQEAELETVRRDLIASIQRRTFLGVLGAGALGSVDLERLEGDLVSKHPTLHTVEDLNSLTRVFAAQSRVLGPAAVIPALQGHLQDHLNLVAAAPAHVVPKLLSGAAEAALLAGVLSNRLMNTSEALRHWLLASALAAESGNNMVHALVLGVRADLHSPVPRGGDGGDPKQSYALRDQAMALIGPRPKGVLAVTLHGWRAGEAAALGDSAGAARDLEAAQNALAKLESVENLTGLEIRTDLELASAHAIAAVQLRQPDKVMEFLNSEIVARHPSTTWRAARLSDLAAAQAQKKDLDQAVATLSEAADLAIAAADPWRFRRVRGIRRTWLPENANHALLAELDRKLTIAPPASA